jgi:hypothetical protein
LAGEDLAALRLASTEDAAMLVDEPELVSLLLKFEP